MNDAHCILVEFVPPDAEKSRFIPARLDVQVAVLGDISFEEDSENIKVFFAEATVAEEREIADKIQLLLGMLRGVGLEDWKLARIHI